MSLPKTDEEKIKYLRESLERFWDTLASLLLHPTTESPLLTVEEVCNDMGEALNDTDPELEGVTGHCRGLYSTYQPLEVLRFITKGLEEKTLSGPRIEPKQLPDYVGDLKEKTDGSTSS